MLLQPMAWEPSTSSRIWLMALTLDTEKDCFILYKHLQTCCPKGLNCTTKLDSPLSTSQDISRSVSPHRQQVTAFCCHIPCICALSCSGLSSHIAPARSMDFHGNSRDCSGWGTSKANLALWSIAWSCWPGSFVLKNKQAIKKKQNTKNNQHTKFKKPKYLNNNIFLNIR